MTHIENLYKQMVNDWFKVSLLSFSVVIFIEEYGIFYPKNKDNILLNLQTGIYSKVTIPLKYLYVSHQTLGICLSPKGKSYDQRKS